MKKADIQIKCYNEILINSYKYMQKLYKIGEVKLIDELIEEAEQKQIDILDTYNCRLKEHDEPNIAMIEVL